MQYKIRKRLNIDESIRKERLTYSIDGIEGIVEYKDFLKVGRKFLHIVKKNEIKIETVDYILGLDAGGIIPTLSFSASTLIPFKLAWKLNLDITNKEVFNEPSASGKNVYIYNLFRNKTIIIVDDEITTGDTIHSLYNVLKKYNITVLCGLFVYKNNNFNRDLFDFPIFNLYNFSM